MKIIIVSEYFNPFRCGRLGMIEATAKLGDCHVIGVGTSVHGLVMAESATDIDKALGHEG